VCSTAFTADNAATKRMWVEKVQAEFAGDSHYLQFHGER
jgi:hypothetical protein